MKYTQVPSDAFQKIVKNAGSLLTNFNPDSPAIVESNIIGITGGGLTFEATPTFIDYGEDIDNVPNDTMELKQLNRYEVKVSGTFKCLDNNLGKMLIAAADIYGNQIIPRSVLKLEDFIDLWWVTDYSDVNTGNGAGWVAIKIENALSTGGFKVQSNDEGKSDFSFEITGHYSLENIDNVPFKVYIQPGSVADATLASLTLGSLTLSPTFSKNTLSYTTSTTDATNTITATATDSTHASVVIKNGTTTVTSGNAATWVPGKNTVTVTVTNDDQVKVYTVEVTKS